MMLCNHFPYFFKVTPLIAAFLCFNESLLAPVMLYDFQMFYLYRFLGKYFCLFEKSWRTDINHVIVGPRYVMEYECLFN